MNDNQLLRYSRHILLPQIDVEGQQKLIDSHVLIIGAGGLGSPVSLYLAASGIGHITISDFDTVDLTNLQRQIVHQTSSIGTNKAESAKAALARINPEVLTETITYKTSTTEIRDIARNCDLIIDCSDNFETRYSLNKICLELKIPLVSGAAIGFEGQVTVFDFRNDDTPCYECLFPQSSDSEELRCAESGVFSPLVGIIGTTQAAEALKLLMGIGRSLQGRLLLLDALNMEWRTINLKRDPKCPCCGVI